jgi:hypothetical protein
MNGDYKHISELMDMGPLLDEAARELADMLEEAYKSGDPQRVEQVLLAHGMRLRQCGKSNMLGEVTNRALILVATRRGEKVPQELAQDYTPLQDWLILYKETHLKSEHGGASLCFMCQAKDKADAVEQCQKANPGCEIRNAYLRQ